MAFTFFFRDMHTFNLVEEHVIPLLKLRRNPEIWDAGCATGEEPYTLAIVLAENMGEFMFRNVRIYASDYNPAFNEIVTRGEYLQTQVDRIPTEIFARYFEPAAEAGKYVVCDKLRKAVQFSFHDLTTLQPVKTGVGLIVCKNVLLHLSHAERLNVIKMYHSALNEDGYLALENTQKMPVELKEWFEPVIADGPLFKRLPLAA